MPYAIGGTVLASEAELTSVQAGSVTSSGISSALGFLPPQLGTVSGTAGDGGALASAQASLSSASTTLSSIGTSVSTLGGTLASLSSVVTSHSASLSSLGTSLSALTPPASALLLGSSPSHSLTAVTLGSNLSLSGGTLSAAAGGAVTLPSSAPLLASSSTGSAVAVTIGPNLLLSGGTLSASGSLSTSFTPTAASTPVLLPDFAARFTHVEDFGAVGDAVTVEDAFWTGGSTQVIFNSENIAAAIVGKTITLRGGGASGADFVTTVATADPNHPNVFYVAKAPVSSYPLPALTDITVVSNSLTISSASHTFSANEIGMFVAVGGVNTTITGVQGTTATIFNYPTGSTSGNGTLTYSAGWATVGTDDAPAINAALASAAKHGGEVLLQAKDYYVAETVLIGSSFVNLRGKGPAATRIVGALGLATVVQIGTANVEPFHVRVSDLAISRAVGTPASTAYGLYAGPFNYLYLDRVLFENQGWGCEVTNVNPNSLSISLRMTDCVFRNCTQYYLSIGQVSDIILNHLELGTNTGNYTVVPYDDQAELYCPVGCVYMHDQGAGSPEVHFNNCLFLPRGPIPYAGTHVSMGISFHNIANSSLYYFDNCYCESITHFINTDDTVPTLQGLYITSGGFTCGDVSAITSTAANGQVTWAPPQNVNFWNLDPATTLGETMLTAVKIEGTFLLTSPFTQLTIIGGLLGLETSGMPSFSVTAATSGGAAGVLVMSGLTIYGDAYLTGNFDRLQVTGINHSFNAIASDTSTAGAPSNKRIVGCIGDACWADVGFVAPQQFTYATLPGASYTPGAMVWCKNARIGSQAAGAGTGSMVQSSGGAWVMMNGAAIQV